MNRLRETSSDAYFDELDQPWDGMELDLHVAKATSSSTSRGQAARSG
jgi:hypothetical protein